MKQLAFITILICKSLIIVASDTTKYNNNVGISFSPIKFEDGDVHINEISTFQIGYNHFIKDYFSIGGYLGGGFLDEWLVVKSDNYIGYTSKGYKPPHFME